jgi:two-component sensor histidine kinase
MTKTSPTSGPGPARRRPLPLAAYIAALMLIVLVPGFIFTVLLLQRNSEAQENILQALTLSASRSIVQGVEREIVANISTLRILAANGDLIAGDLRSFHAQVTAALDGTGSYVYLLDSELYTIMSTRTPFEGGRGALSADLASGRRALESRDVVVSDLVFGRVSQQYVVNILLPVFIPGQSPMVMGLSRNAADLGRALLDGAMADGWSAVLVDSTGAVITGSPGAAATGEVFTLVDAASLGELDSWSLLDVDGRAIRAAVQRSPVTGWTLIAWADNQVVSRPLSDAFWSLVIGGLLLAGMVLLGALWVIRRIDTNVRGVAAEARLLGAGRPIPPRNYPIAEIATVSEAIGAAAKQRATAETEVRFLMRELAHRSKNQMTVIASMARQTAKSADSLDGFVQGFEKRIAGLARSTDLLMAHGAAGVDLAELVEHQLESVRPGDGGRVAIAGPAVRLNAQSAQTMGMAIHELSTNAAKYGAFQGDTGTLDVRWWREDDLLVLVWRETVPDLSLGTERKGFGTRVLQSMVTVALAATVTRTLHPDGIEWRFAIPIGRLDPGNLSVEESGDGT